jgi:asparagine synthase (glutamine-hydrolysing)
MIDAIAHRGPDDSGSFVEEGIALGQRRLSIIDLSSAGHQPMSSVDGNLVLVFNGEIYNYQELKQEFKEYPFQTKTDTEVILAAYQRWGKDCVKHFNGMFAFAIWDKNVRELLIFRDRLGIKPLYYYQHEGYMLFTSEVRALLKSGLVPKKLNRASLTDYLRYQTVHAPDTIVAGIQMLLPGHYLRVKEGRASLHQYWSAEKDFSQEASHESYAEIKKKVYNLLKASVKRRLVADVPFGAFLSGGIDSSAIVGLMSQVASHKVKTFAVTFEEKAFSEAKYASIIANKFGTEHTEIKLKPEDFLELIPAALKAMDHPSGDGPNTYVVSKVTREAGVTMALSGLGGDELFAGYSIFKRQFLLKNLNWVTKIPPGIRKYFGGLTATLKPTVATNKLHQLLSLSEWSLQQSYPVYRQVLADNNIRSILGEDFKVSNAAQIAVEKNILSKQPDRNIPFLSKVSLAEIHTYMQNTLLRDTDQMSMAHALEVRVPFMDHELLEYVLGIPDKYKYPSTPKKLLVESMGDLLPSEIVNRPKMGFTLPWKEWIRNDLFDFCKHRMELLGQHPAFDELEVKRLWQSFLKHNPAVSWSHIWYLVVLQNWLMENEVE